MNKSTAKTEAAATENNEVKVNRIIDQEQLHVRIIDGKAMVPSRIVADVFKKRHDNVIRDIESLQVPDTWFALNFEEIQTPSDLGMGRTREDKAYNMTRDGFTILAMGFTGQRAMEFKLAYIEAFNAMELTLRRQWNNYLACTDEWMAKLARIEVKNCRIMLDGKVLIPENLLFYVLHIERMDFLAAMTAAGSKLINGVDYFEFPEGEELKKLKEKLLNIPFVRPLNCGFNGEVYRFWTEEGIRKVKDHSDGRIDFWDMVPLSEMYFFRETSSAPLPTIDFSSRKRLKAPKSFERPAGSEEKSRLFDKYIELTLLEKDFIKKELLEQWEELTYQQKLEVIVFIGRDLRKSWSN